MGELRKHTWPHTLMNLCSGSIDESPGVGANCSTDWFRECCTSNSGKWCQPLMPVDINPTSSMSNDWDNVVLQKTGRVLDAVNGILVGPVLRQDPSSITFAVRLFPPSCVRTGPAVTVDTPPQPVAVSPGGVHSFNIVIENRDSLACGTSDFLASVVTPPNWSSVFASQNPVSITPFRGSGWISGEIQVSPTAPAGAQYTLRFTVTNTASGRSVTIPIKYIVQ